MNLFIVLINNNNNNNNNNNKRERDLIYEIVSTNISPLFFSFLNLLEILLKLSIDSTCPIGSSFKGTCLFAKENKENNEISKPCLWGGAL